VFEFIWCILFDYLVCGPGAFFIWAFKGFKGTYSEILKNYIHRTAVVGIVFWAFVLTVIGLVARTVS